MLSALDRMSLKLNPCPGLKKANPHITGTSDKANLRVCKKAGHPLKAPGPSAIASDHALIKHGIRHFDETADVGAEDVIARLAILLRSLDAGAVNRFHDGV